MNLTEIRAEAGLLFGDPDFRHISSSQWDTLINKAENRICEITKSLVTRVDCSTITVDTQYFDMSSGGFFGSYDIIEVRRLLSDNKELIGADEDELLSASDSFRGDDSGTTKYWYVTAGFKLGIYPKSDVALTSVKADIVHYPTGKIESNPGEVPQVNRLFHGDIVMLAAMYASMQGSDVERLQYFNSLVSEGIREHMSQYNNRRGFSLDQSVSDFANFS